MIIITTGFTQHCASYDGIEGHGAHGTLHAHFITRNKHMAVAHASKLSNMVTLLHLRPQKMCNFGSYVGSDTWNDLTCWWTCLMMTQSYYWIGLRPINVDNADEAKIAKQIESKWAWTIKMENKGNKTKWIGLFLWWHWAWPSHSVKPLSERLVHGTMRTRQYPINATKNSVPARHGWYPANSFNQRSRIFHRPIIPRSVRHE